MELLILFGGSGLVLFAAFLWSCLRMSREPDPPQTLDPEIRAQLAQLQARGRSRSEWEGDHPPVGGGNRAA